MQSLVLQLQQECMDSQIPVLEILRKALVVARKLCLTDAQVWIEKELNGYDTGDAPPPHRLIKGEIRAWNPYHGWIPILYDDAKEAELHSKCYVGQPVGELEELIRHGKGGNLQFPFGPELQKRIMDGMGVPLQPTRILNQASVKGVLDSVRNMVLEWSLQLEKNGILGEGLVFSTREKQAAASASYITNYNGPVTHSQVQQGSPNATQTLTVGEIDKQAIQEFLRALQENTAKLDLSRAANDRLNAEAERVRETLASPSAGRTALTESLKSIRIVLEECAGSLLASGLLYELGKLLR
jgi:hypothetical protein